MARTLEDIDNDIRRIEAEHSASTQHGSYRGKDLTDHDFSGQDLSGSNFRESTLVDANFKDAILVGCNFRDAITTGADFEGAIVYGTPWQEDYLDATQKSVVSNEKPAWIAEIDTLQEEMMAIQEA